MAKSSDSNDVKMKNSVTIENERTADDGTTPSKRKRPASQAASSYDRTRFPRLEPGCSRPLRESAADPSCAAKEAIRPCGFLRIEGATSASRIPRDQAPREDMMLYNWQKMTMSVLSADAIYESQIIQQPLAQILCRATSVLIKDGKVFAAVSTSTAHVIQVCDLQTGQLLKEIDSYLLTGESRILLRSYRHRIYAAEFGGQHICEVLPDYRLHKVAKLKGAIANFLIEHLDGNSFLCTYTDMRDWSPSFYMRIKGRCSDHSLQWHSNFPIGSSIIGCHAGKSYLLNSRSGVVIVDTDNKIFEFRLAEKIYFPYSLSHCGELIYILREGGVHVINTRTRRRYTISNPQFAQKVDEECRLIKRLTTLPCV